MVSYDRKYFHDVAFLKFSKNWNIKKFIYVASIGSDKWTFRRKDEKAAKKFLKDFIGISFREKGLVKLGSKTDIENGVTNKAATPAAIKDFVKENAPKIWYDNLTEDANPSTNIQNFEDIKIGDFFYNLDSQGGIYDLFICTVIDRDDVGNELVWSKINYKTATSQDINNLFTNPLQDAENVNF